MAETFANSLINNSIYHLLNFEKYSSFQAAAREAAINNNFQLVLLSSDFNTVFSVETKHNVSIEEAVHYRLAANVEQNQKGARVDVNGLLTYWGPINISGERHYLMLADNDASYSQEEISKLAEIIELAMGMWNYRPERDITAEFIKALRRGNRSLAYSLKNESDFADEKIAGVYFVPGVPGEEGIRILSDFGNKYGIRHINIAESDEFCGVLFEKEQTEKDEKSYSETRWKEIARKMSEAGAKMTFYVSELNGIEDACNAFQIINETEPFIQLIFPYKKSFSKYELAMASNCVNICLNGGSVKKNYLDLLKPFKHTGEGKIKQLMETLETFILDAGMSTAKTSRLMEIHSNTVQYRLKRIKEILGVDITENTIVPGLMMALAIARIEKKVKSF